MILKTMRILQNASVVFLIVILYVSIFPFNSTTSASSFATSKSLQANNEEALALLKWKSSLDKQSQAVLSSWEIMSLNSSNYCISWFGIGCNKAGRIDSITIKSSGLKGKLSDLNFSSLHHLTTVKLYNNSLYGTIPQEIGSLRSLTLLSLSRNNLSGLIPSSIGNLSNLTVLYLWGNKLVGTVPREIGELTSITELYLSINNLSGSIPREIGQLTSLTELDFSINNMSGPIPSSIGNLSNLAGLYLWGNKLVGVIPREIGQLTSLTELDISTNNLSGPIPSSIGNLSNLAGLYMWGNKLVGTIPREIGQLTSLTMLYFSTNNLSGPIPSFIGNLSNLTVLYLGRNHLEGLLPVSLNNITKLKEFEISENHISGQLPDNICKSGSLKLFVAINNNFTGKFPKTLKTCTSLQRLRLAGNHIRGDISNDLGVYPHLYHLDLSDNNFYGELSRKWGLFQNLSTLQISNNNISGSIPAEIGLLPKLQKLDFSSNRLSGHVPKNLGKLLLDINLSNNEIIGSILVEVGDYPNLETLNLAANKFIGFVPTQLSGCLKLRLLNLSKNRFDGDISFEIGSFHVLEDLDLAQNLLSGDIPQQLGQLRALHTLNLSHNKFSGSIPHSFNSLESLISLDLSYNQLEGPVPSTKAFKQLSFHDFRENKNFCGNFTGLKECPLKEIGSTTKKKNKTTIIIVFAITFSLLILVILGFLVCRRNQQKTISHQTRENNGNIFSIWSYDGKLVYDNIIAGTENFDRKYCIGVGGSGAVYKVEQTLAETLTEVFAVKKIHSVEIGDLNSQKAFTSEIRALAEIRHRNIVKLYGFCSHSQHSFLVYEFLEGGNLCNILNDENKAADFEWPKRIDVIKGVANGLSYMHHDCSTPIVHRDISSKNILLDKENVAHISDFGTARILKTNSTNCTSFAGTFGYAAPELAHTMEVNEMQDVYSFGVLALEVLMGRHPGDLVSQFSSPRQLPDEFKSTLLKDVLDQRIRIQTTIHEFEVIVSSLKIAFACLQVVPRHRPTMKQVSTELSKQKTQQNLLFPMTLGNLFDSYCLHVGI